jgi:hypothetical protein
VIIEYEVRNRKYEIQVLHTSYRLHPASSSFIPKLSLPSNQKQETMGEYSLGDALKYFLNHSRMKGSIQALQIEDVWEQIMGKKIARYTDKIQILGKTLYITTSMAPLKQELLYQKDNIIKRVNEILGEYAVKDVVIQ